MLNQAAIKRVWKTDEFTETYAVRLCEKDKGTDQLIGYEKFNWLKSVNSQGFEFTYRYEESLRFPSFDAAKIMAIAIGDVWRDEGDSKDGAVIACRTYDKLLKIEADKQANDDTDYKASFFELNRKYNELSNKNKELSGFVEKLKTEKLAMIREYCEIRETLDNICDKLNPQKP